MVLHLDRSAPVTGILVVTCRTTGVATPIPCRCEIRPEIMGKFRVKCGEIEGRHGMFVMGIELARNVHHLQRVYCTLEIILNQPLDPCGTTLGQNEDQVCFRCMTFFRQTHCIRISQQKTKIFGGGEYQGSFNHSFVHVLEC